MGKHRNRRGFLLLPSLEGDAVIRPVPADDIGLPVLALHSACIETDVVARSEVARALYGSTLFHAGEDGDFFFTVEPGELLIAVAGAEAACLGDLGRVQPQGAAANNSSLFGACTSRRSGTKPLKSTK